RADGSGEEVAAAAAEEGAASVSAEREKAAGLRVDADERAVDRAGDRSVVASTEAGIDADLSIGRDAEKCKECGSDKEIWLHVCPSCLLSVWMQGFAYSLDLPTLRCGDSAGCYTRQNSTASWLDQAQRMLFKARSAAVYGIDAHIIDVEVDY